MESKKKQLFSKDGVFLCPQCGTPTSFDIHISKERCPNCGGIFTCQVIIEKERWLLRIRSWAESKPMMLKPVGSIMLYELG